MFAKDDPFKLTLSILFMSFESCLARSLCEVGFGELAFLWCSVTFLILHSEWEINMANGAVCHFNAGPK